MGEYIYSFEKLEVWKKAKELSIFIYKLTKQLPDEEKFGLISQMRRSSISIASNLAEGSSRSSSNEQSHFYTIAYSSAIELLNQLIISFELGFITEKQLSDSRTMIQKNQFRN